MESAVPAAMSLCRNVTEGVMGHYLIIKFYGLSLCTGSSLSKRDSFNASLTLFKLSLNFAPTEGKAGGQHIYHRQLGKT
jgi:hypothetical protein